MVSLKLPQLLIAMKKITLALTFLLTLQFVHLEAARFHSADFLVNPYERQVQEQREILIRSKIDTERAGAAEALGFLRAYTSEGDLIAALKDESEVVRREAAVALAWCGGRATIGPLTGVLDGTDNWIIKQAAWTALTNVTGMEFPYDAREVIITIKNRDVTASIRELKKAKRE